MRGASRTTLARWSPSANSLRRSLGGEIKVRTTNLRREFGS